MVKQLDLSKKALIKDPRNKTGRNGMVGNVKMRIACHNEREKERAR